ncbi:alpha/beta fold hydrolase [Pseudovibrio exalbescens]|uniref:Dihydrolipoamide acetyltransferase n=1 Tax=Pseudovibrio exalbescens TaxID=197461 RepID=A0A1U7JJC3_9HYPH|nr:alpha/beta fold hydrolase [Pseudovibrio exalbescens]OKL44817.1 dihydrolipoamide acetyltransferase [Pseudovibrio exalbescens]
MSEANVDTQECLPHIQQGPAGQPPIILLHGFGSDATTWNNIQLNLERQHHSLAFDLPGHGKALDWPRIGNAVVAAKAVNQSLDALALERFHLVGHSLGGAVASLVAMRAPAKVASLTLLSPGGFGPEINAQLLRRYAAATTPEEQAPLLEQFYGINYKLPRKLAEYIAEQRCRPGAQEALATISSAFLENDQQGVLPLPKLAELPCPISVVWGTQDRVLPPNQVDNAPGSMAKHIFEGVGHMLHLEIPQDILRIIREAAR